MAVEGRAQRLANMPALILAARLIGNEYSLSFRHPLLVAGAATSAATAFGLLGNGAPVWPEASVLIAGALLPLAASSFLVAAWVAMRDTRVGIREWLDSLPRDPRSEALGRLGLAAAPLTWSLVVMAAAVLYVIVGGPTGAIVWWELLGGPLTVVLGWVLGVACGYATKSGVVPVVLVIGATFVQLVASPDVSISAFDHPNLDLSRLALWNPPSAFETAESVALRPSSAHLGYLLVLSIAGVMSAVTLRSRDAAPSRRLGGVTTAGWVLVALVATGLVRGGEPRLDWDSLIAGQACETHSGVDYCAFDTYTGWIPLWVETLDRTSDLIPSGVSKVVQRPANIGIGEDPVAKFDDVVITTTEWDRPDTSDPVHQMDLAVQSTFPSVGLPTIGDGLPCSAAGQARAAVALWVAAVTVEHGENVLRSAVLEGGGTAFSGGRLTIGHAVFGTDSALLALALSELDIDRVSVTLAERWQEVVDPESTVDELAAWFGLEIEQLEPPPEYQAAIPLGPCL